MGDIEIKALSLKEKNGVSVDEKYQKLVFNPYKIQPLYWSQKELSSPKTYYDAFNDCKTNYDNLLSLVGKDDPTQGYSRSAYSYPLEGKLGETRQQYQTKVDAWCDYMKSLDEAHEKACASLSQLRESIVELYIADSDKAGGINKVGYEDKFKYIKNLKDSIDKEYEERMREAKMTTSGLVEEGNEVLNSIREKESSCSDDSSSNSSLQRRSSSDTSSASSLAEDIRGYKNKKRKNIKRRLTRLAQLIRRKSSSEGSSSDDGRKNPFSHHPSELTHDPGHIICPELVHIVDNPHAESIEMEDLSRKSEEITRPPSIHKSQGS